MNEINVTYPDGAITRVDIHRPTIKKLTNCLHSSDPFLGLRLGGETEINLYLAPAEAAVLNAQLTAALATQEAPGSDVSQIQSVGAPAPKTWEDYRLGCVSTFRGGHHDPDMARAFRHGMNTVFNLLQGEFPPAEQCKAAPNLLEACKAMLDDLAETACLSVWDFAANSEIGEAAFAAIAKAEPDTKQEAPGQEPREQEAEIHDEH